MLSLFEVHLLFKKTKIQFNSEKVLNGSYILSCLDIQQIAATLIEIKIEKTYDAF